MSRRQDFSLPGKHRALAPHSADAPPELPGTEDPRRLASLALATARRMSSARPRFSLELFKFATYLSIPIAMTVAFAANPENLETIIKRHAYVVYPPEGPKPPTNAEMKKIVEANRKKRKV